MPFAPVINDIGPGLILAHQKMQQDRELANQEMLFNAMSSVASGIGSAVSSWNKDRERRGLVDGKEAAYETMSKTDPTMVDPSFVSALKKESNYGRKIGMIMAEEEMRPFKQRKGYLESQTNAAANLAAFKETLPQPAKGRVLATDQGLFRDTGSGEPEPIMVNGKQLQPKASAANPMDILFGGGSSKPSAVVSAPEDAAPAGAATSAYREGQKAKNSSGETVVFKGGKWERL
ncbi:MAG: hypothetical protein ACOYM3_07205 [Terrimicrobiaceae bacterium]